MSVMIKNIAVVGSGLPLVMSCALLASSLKLFKINVIAIEIPTDPNQSQIEICGPEFSPLCKILGLNEVDLIRKCDATFRLGDQYLVNDRDWFVPFAHIGLKAEQDDFEQGLFQCLQSNDNASLSKFSAASAAALAGKFAIAGSDRPDLRKALDYGVQVDSQKYLDCLKIACRQLNVEWYFCKELELELEKSQHGDLKAVRIEAKNILADFWVDASQGRLLSPENNQPESSKTVPISHVCEWHSAVVDLGNPYTSIQRLEGAWLRTIPLRNRTVYQVFAEHGNGDLSNIEKQLTSLKIDGLIVPNWRNSNCQKLPNPWQNNVLTIGNQSLGLGGLLISELQCIQAALIQLIDLFPNLPIGELNRSHYNQQWQKFAQDTVDYLAVHFLTTLTNSSDLPDSLTNRIQVFERLGRLTPLDSDAITESQWYHILYGLGFRPQLPSVVLSKYASESIQAGLQKVEHSIVGLVNGMPPHEQYLNRFYPIFSV